MLHPSSGPSNCLLPPMQFHVANERHEQGLLLLRQRRVQEASQKFEEALRLGFDPMQGIAQRWCAWMLLGDFERAWQETDRIELRRRKGLPVQGALVWDGTNFCNKSVLLTCDHGLGDTIQFIRYATLLRDRCSMLSAKARPILLPLLRSVPGVDLAITCDEHEPRYDVRMECTELPYVFRTHLDTIPCNIPYLGIAGRKIPARRNLTLKVGLSWAAGPWNPKRSISLSELKPLSEISSVSFQSLQWGPAWKDAQCSDHDLSFADVASAPQEDLLVLASTIIECDLVISVDTMAAHLAGALGKPVWVLLTHDSDWRWMLERGDSPWYPTMKLFRQEAAGDWSVPVRQVVRELHHGVHSSTQ
jgi:hypothetical protein